MARAESTLKLLVGDSWKATAMIVGGFTAVGALAAALGLAFGQPAKQMVVLFAAIALPIPALRIAHLTSTLLHELGHAVAAWTLGLRVLQIQVDDIVLAFHGEPKSYVGHFMGSVFIANSLRCDRRWPATLISLAGPGFNLVVVASLIFLPRLSDYFKIALAATASFSALSAYRSLVPSATKPGGSDIHHVIDYWRPESQIFARRSLTRIWPVIEGANPNLVDPEDVRRALWVEAPHHRLQAAQIAAYHAIGTRASNASSLAADFAQRAEAALDAAENDEDHNSFRGLVEDALLEEAFARALFDRDLDSSSALVDRLTWIGKNSYDTARRVFAAQTLAAGDSRGALEQTQHARLMLKSSPLNAMIPTAELFLNLVEEDAAAAYGGKTKMPRQDFEAFGGGQ